MPLVEIVPGERTTEDAVSAAVDFYTFLGRTPVVVRKEMPGFVGNRLQNAINREASYLVQQGVVTPEDVDKVVTNSLGIRYATIGPFLSGHLGGGPGGYRHLADHIGKEMDKMQLGEVTQDPKVRERLIEAVEKTYGADSYAELAAERDRKQLAVLNALASVNHNKKEK
jgi:ketoreductase RED1